MIQGLLVFVISTITSFKLVHAKKVAVVTIKRPGMKGRRVSPLERLNSLSLLTACRKKKSETPNKGKPTGANGLVYPQLLQAETRLTFIRTVNLST